MPYCSAVGCQNASAGKYKKEGVSMFGFPKDADLLKKWLHNMSRKNFTPTKHSKLCSDHFTPDCFKEDIYKTITKKALYNAPRLKEDAVPTLFAHTQVGRDAAVSRSRTHTERRLAKKAKSEMLDRLLEGQSQTPKLSVPTKKPRVQSIAQKRKTVSAASTKSSAMASEVQQATPPLYIAQPQPIYGNPLVVERDHSYSQRIPTHPPATVQAEAPVTLPAPITPAATSTSGPSKMDEVPAHVSTESVMAESSSPESNEDDAGARDTSREDPDYNLPSPQQGTSDSESVSESSREVESERKFIVYESSLRKLLGNCTSCSKPVIELSDHTTGSMVTFKMTCIDGHETTWSSQPSVGRMPLGNLTLSGAILFTGNTYTRTNDIMKAAGIQFFSKSTFNRIQRKKLFPVVQEMWCKEQKSILEDLSKEDGITLSGDCRCDSPGHCAKYGTYSLMESSDRPGDKIVDFQLVQCTEVKNSNHMEPEGLKRSIQKVSEAGVNIKCIATDQHVQVKKILQETAFIDHQFDVWHVAKNMVKKLSQAAKLKRNAGLGPWIQSVSNHLWWSCKTCNGDAQLLREKWISILNHITNKHTWTTGVQFHKCQHKPLTDAEREGKMWMDPKSPAFKVLQEAVLNKRLLDALPHMTKFCHTGQLEVFHSMMAKYVPKRIHFPYEGMKTRTMLAVLDWNSRVRSGDIKYDVVASKRRKAWIIRQRSQRTGGLHIAPLMERTLDAHIHGVDLPLVERPAELAPHIGPEQKPAKDEMLAKYKSRFDQ